MTVNKLSGNRVLIILCEKDMHDFSLDYDTLSFDDTNSRKVIMRILQVACLKSGIETKGKCVNVEALSLEDDCYILVTVKRRKGHTYRLKQTTDCLCYFVGNGSNFLDTIDALCRQNVYCNKNSAYLWNGEYYLIFDYPTIPQKLKTVLSEYAEKCSGRLIAARIKESGKLLCSHNAIMQIGKFL